MRVLVVVNPTAGSGRAVRLAPRVAGLLRAGGRDVETIISSSGLHLREVVAASQADQIIAVGGDGTAHDAARGIIASGCRAALGVVPAGSGNDFARGLGMPTDVNAAAAALLRAPIEHIDYGRVTWIASEETAESVFVNAIGCGFDAAVAARARGIRHLRGIPRYLVAIFQELPRWTSPTLTLESDTFAWEGEALLATVANGKSSGGGFRLTPNADFRDGMLDLCIAHQMSIPRILRVLPAALSGRHLGLPEISFANATWVRMTFDRGVPIHLDGEIATLDARSASVEVIPKRLKALIPSTLNE